MLRITDLESKMLPELSKLAAQSFYESHGNSAAMEDLDEYVGRMFSVEQLKIEMDQAGAIFRLAFVENELAGYSKIVLNRGLIDFPKRNISKMDRLYVLKKYLDLKIGKKLMDIDLEIARQNNQSGMWLYVWTGNARALHFYQREGFKKIGEEEFKISARHSNPNYIMYKDL